MKQLKKLRDTNLPPLREVILTSKSSRPALCLRARLNTSGNSGLPFNLGRVDLTGPFVYPGVTSGRLSKTRRQLNNEVRKDLTKTSPQSDVFVMSLSSEPTFLGSKAPGYPQDIHLRILPSATSHYIRCRKIDQYFRSVKAQIVRFFVARRNFVDDSSLAGSGLLASMSTNTLPP